MYLSQWFPKLGFIFCGPIHPVVDLNKFGMMLAKSVSISLNHKGIP